MSATVTTESGLPNVGELDWGTHFCHFYRDREDLVDSLVPYFKAGLEGNESCLWITSEPFRAEDARSVLQEAVPDLDRRLAAGQIEIRDYQDWYRRNAEADPDGVIQGWLSRCSQALERGYNGLRLTGNTYWLEKRGWQDFADYERRVNETFRHHRIIGLCSYCLGRCSQEEVFDVVRNHEFTLVRRAGEWEHIETGTLKRAKSELRQLAEQLEQRVLERTAELEAALRVRDEFLSVASHELKTPITALKLYVDSLRRVGERGGLTGDELVARLAKAQDQCARLDKLINNLLDVSRANTTGLRLEPEELDLAVLVRQTLERLEPTLRAAGSDVRVQVAGEARGCWDRLRLEQVLGNLLTNCARHAPGSPVEVRLSSGPGQVCLEVRDYGPGIASAERARIFDRFAQGGSGPRAGGFGLGLWIVREIVAAHGGEVGVRDPAGGGAAFTLLLPTGTH